MSAARRLPLAWLIPRPGEPGAAIARRTRLLLTISLGVANLIGAAIVFALAAWVLPPTDVEEGGSSRTVNLIAAGAYMLVVVPIGTIWGTRRLSWAREWLEADRTPTPKERRVVLRAPRRIVFVHAVLWSLAAVVFGVLNATYSFELAQRAAITIVLGGLTTCAIVYLLSERQLRAAATRALAAGIGDRRLGPGVKTRAFLAWGLGTGVPIVGLILIAISTLTEEDFSRTELAVTVLALGGLALVVGLGVSMLAARAVADPVVSLRKAVKKVADGELDVEVPVYDGSEVGQLQAGFNNMVAGLRERERIQDLFGRHVGEDVARAALEQDVELGGEVREVAVLFTDIVGSTELAAKRPPQEVVGLLNRFFAVVVEVVDARGGSVNKFEGDAALAIFGAPMPLDDAPSSALAAARELAARLEVEVTEVEAAIGVSAGEVVAGNIGEERRFEYTVIGDPVNEAARLTELAKERPGRLLASGSTVEAASSQERERWKLTERVELRGRAEDTRLAVPAGEASG
ncbi:MAG: adenylate/guanylate cyclase domain-containing protein [Solirubrobacterales bacterium]